MSDIAIRVENLGKQYRIGKRERYQTLRDTLTDTVTAPFRWLRNGRSANGNSAPDHIWALKDVSFEIPRGEVVGIIGRNGAGKSTLLKVLSRITEPTEGHAEIHGRVGSLLEVGTGFHPELTGRENIYLNGAILGMRKAEIARKFDEIVAFAEIEKFLDTPVKHYSSGMYMRLAFAVAAHLDPEILIVDEVLAVGDAQFQKKCLGKIGDVAKQGRTVILVSHNIGAIRQLCHRSLLLKSGSLSFYGATQACVQEYLGPPSGSGPLPVLRAGGGISRPVQIVTAYLTRGEAPVSTVLFGDELDLVLVVRARSRVRLSVELQLRQAEGVPIAFAASGLGGGIEFSLSEGDYFLKARLPQIKLSQSVYHIDIGLADTGRGFFDYVETALSFSVLPSPIGPRNWYFSDAAASFFWEVDFNWEPRPASDLPLFRCSEVFEDIAIDA
jgi:lipopolysaccharide transport system ATP-binding protein